MMVTNMNSTKLRKFSASKVRGNEISMMRSVLLVSAIVVFGLGWLASGSQRRAIAGSPPPGTPFAQFVGDWDHVGGNGLLSIQPNGHGIDHFRTYLQCDGTGHVTDCDKTIGRTVYPGGFIAMTLNKVYGNQAFGTIGNASSSWEVGTRVQLVIGKNDILTIQDAAGSTRTCGVRAHNLKVGGCR
jgi:hypothetical protein